jgi:tRNA-splicing ligase RtcB
MESGWKPGPALGAALVAAEHLSATGCHPEEILPRLEQVLQQALQPNELATDLSADPVLGELLAKARLQYAQAGGPSPVLDEPVAPLQIWGQDLLEPSTLQQIQDARRLDVTARTALMPDGHVGYGLPVGGVWGVRGAVSPYAVGVDIACRMRLSLIPAERGAEIDWRDHDVQGTAPSSSRRERFHQQLREALVSQTCFGAGQGFNPRLDHDVLDDPAWQQLPKRIQAQKDRAHKQLGSSGGGNHFVEFGTLELHEAVESLGLAPGRYLALMSHSGSRGLGHAICSTYADIAMKVHDLPKKYKRLACLSLDSEAGQEYWTAMNLAGRYAQANHQLIHQRVLEAAGLEPAAMVENHHNFAWLEEHDGEELVVHRKGATPAGRGELGVIPGSRETPGFLVEGLGHPGSLRSASHGAGRVMSRSRAVQSLHGPSIAKATQASGVDVIASGLDEAPPVYKDIHAVMAAQTDLIRVLGTFRPRIVLMASDGSSED